MKICLVNSLYPPYNRGGAEVVVTKIVDGLLAQNHQVVLITLGRKEGKQQEGNLTIYRIKPLNVFSFIDIDKKPIWLRLFWHPLDVLNFSGAAKVRKILKQERPAAVLTHNLKGIGYLIPRVIKKLGIPHLHTLHDVQLSRPSGLIFFGQEKPFLILDKIYERICRTLFNSPDVIISPSQWLLDYYRRRGFFNGSKLSVLPNPVIFKKVKKQQEAEDSSGKIKLLYAGQLENLKGIVFLIEACKKIKLSNWQLLIIGAGSLEDKVKALVEGDNRFYFIGRLEHDQLIDFYRQVDLTIVPSLCYENSPTVIYESLVANVPVIASDIGGIPEIIKDDYNGFTFAPGNEKNLIEVLEHFLSHPENILDLKKNCFVSVYNFSLNNYIRKILDFVKSAAK